MGQTTAAITFRNAKVELSSDGSTWSDVSGSTSAVIVDGGERPVTEFVPLFSETTKAKTGERARVDIVVKSVYTEVPGEAYSILDTAYLIGGEIGLRWTPAGGSNVGSIRYYARGANVKKPAYPGGEVGEAKIIMAEYELSAEYIDKETIT